jgi:hypothetical protein
VELNDHIANSLIRMVHSMAQDWPCVIRIEPGIFEQAANCSHTQQGLANEIKNQLAGQNLVVTIDCVTDAIERLGWECLSGNA